MRTSDLSNWEIKADFKHGVSEAIYREYRSTVDVQAGDIFMVRDGTYLIGTTAIVTESDLPMLFRAGCAAGSRRAGPGLGVVPVDY